MSNRLEPTRIVDQQSQIDMNTIQKEVGSGAFGTVYRIEDKQGKPYALKKIKLSDIHYYRRHQQQRREIQISQKIKNPYIVQFYDVQQDKNFLKIKMQYVQGVNLRDYLLRSPHMSIQDRKRLNIKITLQILNAVGCLRYNRIINRDIKPDNIMIKNVDNIDEVMIKMIDFGQAKYANTIENTIRTGTETHMAPQVYKGLQYDDSCDIWSLGVMIFQIFQGSLQLQPKNDLHLPFRANRKKFNPKQYFQQDIYDPLILSTTLIPDPIRHILRRMLEPDRKERIKFSQILAYLDHTFEQLSEYLEQEQYKQEKQQLVELVIQENKIQAYIRFEKQIGERIKRVYSQIYVPIQRQLNLSSKQTHIDMMVLLQKVCKQIFDLVDLLQDSCQSMMGQDTCFSIWIQEYLTNKQSKEIQNYAHKLLNRIQIRSDHIFQNTQFRLTQPILQFIDRYFRANKQRMVDILKQQLEIK